MFENFMTIALLEAKNAAQKGEVPVGAVIVKNNQVLCQGHNLVRTFNNPILHAEIVVIQKASEILQNYRLDGCDLYVTLEPCTMCAGAIAQARIRRLYYGASDPKGGAIESGIRFFSQSTCHHKLDIYGGISEAASGSLLRSFFQEL